MAHRNPFLNRKKKKKKDEPKKTSTPKKTTTKSTKQTHSSRGDERRAGARRAQQTTPVKVAKGMVEYGAQRRASDVVQATRAASRSAYTRSGSGNRGKSGAIKSSTRRNDRQTQAQKTRSGAFKSQQEKIREQREQIKKSNYKQTVYDANGKKKEQSYTQGFSQANIKLKGKMEKSLNEATSNLNGKAKDYTKAGMKLADEMVDYLIPYGATTKTSLKIAEGALKASKTVKAGEALTKFSEGGLKKLSKDGKKKVIKEYTERVAKGEKPQDVLESIQKQVMKSDLKQNVKRELLANAMQDATIGTTIDAIKGKQQGLEGKEFRNYMLENAAINAAIGVPVSRIAGRTGKAGKIALANETSQAINREFAKVGGATREEAKELLKLTEKSKAMEQIGETLSTAEKTRVEELRSKVVNSASGIAQVKHDGKLVVNDKGVARDVFSENELNNYITLKMKIKSGAPISATERGQYKELSKRMGKAYKTVEMNSVAAVNLAQKGAPVDLDMMDSAVNFREKMGGTKAQIKEAKEARTKSAMKLFDVDRDTATVITKTGERTNGKLSVRPMTELEAQMKHQFPKDQKFQGMRFTKNDGSGEQIIYFNPEAEDVSIPWTIAHEFGHVATTKNSKFIDAMKEFAGDDWKSAFKDTKEIYDSFDESMLRESGLSPNAKTEEETACNLLGTYVEKGDIDLFAYIAGKDETLFGKFRSQLKKIFDEDGALKNNPTLKKINEHIEEAYDALKHPKMDDVIMTSMMRGAHAEDFSVGGEYAPVFYSKMYEAVDSHWGKNARFGADEHDIKKFFQKCGVKDEEYKWSGMDAFLEGKKSVTKQEMLDFIKANSLELNEKKRSGSAWYEDQNLSKGVGNYGTRWGEYTLWGGNNYREYEYILPNSNGYLNDAMKMHWEDRDVVVHSRVQDFDAQLVIDQASKESKYINHENGKVLHIEEIQSDWHNAGAKYGYADDASGGTSVEVFKKWLDKNAEDPINVRNDGRVEFDLYNDGKELWALTAKEEDGNILFYRNQINEDYDDKVDNLWNYADYNKEWGLDWGNDVDEDLIDFTYDSFNKIVRTHSGVPDAPYKNNYTEYAFKRALREAAEKDYNYVSWTTAKQQADRWSDEYAEGYRIEYDQEIPSFADKYIKKLDPNSSGVKKIILSENGEVVWGVEVTPAMKETVLYKGQESWSVGGKKSLDENNVDPQDFALAKDPKKLMERREELVSKFKYSYPIAQKNLKKAIEKYLKNGNAQEFKEAKKEIFHNFEWYQGYDGKWRYWISDADLKFELGNKFKGVKLGEFTDSNGAKQEYVKGAMYGNRFVGTKGEYDAPLAYFDVSTRKLKTASQDTVRKYEKELLRLDEQRQNTKSKTLRGETKEKYEKIQRALFMYKMATDGIELGKVVQHDDFFALYPEAMSLKLKFGSSTRSKMFEDYPSSVTGGRGNSLGQFDPETRELRLNPYMFYKDSNIVRFYEMDGVTQDQLIKRTLVHELEHNTQHFEGFSAGGSEDLFGLAPFNHYPKNYKDSEKILTHIAERQEAYDAMQREVLIRKASTEEEGELDAFISNYREAVDWFALENQLSTSHSTQPVDPYDVIFQDLSTYKKGKATEAEQNEFYVRAMFDDVTSSDNFGVDAVKPLSKTFEANMKKYILADIEAARLAERDPYALYLSLAGEQEARDVSDQLFKKSKNSVKKQQLYDKLKAIKQEANSKGAEFADAFASRRDGFIKYNEENNGAIATKKMFSSRDEYINFFTEGAPSELKPLWKEYIESYYDWVGLPAWGKIRGKYEKPDIPITEGANVRLASDSLDAGRIHIGNDGDSVLATSSHPAFYRELNNKKFKGNKINELGEADFSTGGRKKTEAYKELEKGQITFEEYLQKVSFRQQNGESSHMNQTQFINRGDAEEKPTVVDGINGAYKGDTSGDDFFGGIDDSYYRMYNDEVKADSVEQPPSQELQKRGTTKEVREQTIGGETITDKQIEQFPLAQEAMAKMSVGVYVPKGLQMSSSAKATADAKPLTIKGIKEERGFDPENNVLKLRKSPANKKGEQAYTIKTLYDEMSKKYPDLFPESITTDSERLNRLLEISNLQGGVVKGKRGSYYLPKDKGGTPSVAKRKAVKTAPVETKKPVAKEAKAEEPPASPSKETVDDFDNYDVNGNPVETGKPTNEELLRPTNHEDFLERARRTYSKEDMNQTAINEYQKVMDEYGGIDEFRKVFEDEIGKGSFGKLKRVGRDEADEIAQKDFKKLGYEEMRKQVMQSEIISEDPNVFVAKCCVLQEEIDRMLKAGEGDRSQLFADKAEIYEKLAGLSTNSSAMMNALKRFSTATPKGRVKTVENEIKRLEKLYKDRIKGGKLEVDEDKLRKLGDLTDQDEIDNLLDEINKDLWEQIPATLFERMNEYRHAFMLFNPKTHMRNTIGNSVFRLCRKVSDYMEAGMLDSKWATKKLSEIENIKPEDVIVDKVHVSKADEVSPNKGLLKNEFEAIYKKSGSRNKFIELGRPDGVDTVRWKAMQKFINFNYWALEHEDLAGALVPAFNKAYVSYCKARCVKSVGAKKYTPDALRNFMENMTEAEKKKARQYALAEGEYATYRDACAFSDWLTGKKQMFAGKGEGWAKYGYRVLDLALEGALPFVKTPVNIFRRSIDFSPVALLRGATRIGKAKNSREFVQGIHDMCTGMTGTAICGMGVFTALHSGMYVKGAMIQAGEQSGDSYYDRDMGYQDYSIIVQFPYTDKEVSITLDWAQPMQASFFSGVAFVNALRDSYNEDTKEWEWNDQSIVNAFFAVTAPLTDTSFMSSPKDTLQRFLERATRTDDGKETDFPSAIVQLLAGDMPKNYFQGFEPQLMAQFAGVFDKNIRDTRGTSNNSFVRGWQSAGRQLINRVPALRNKMLNPKLNRKGEDVKSDDNIAVRMFQSLFNPANVKTITKDKYDEELIKIRNNIEDKSSNDYKYFYYNLTGNPPMNLVNGKRMTYNEMYTYGKESRTQQNSMIETMVDAKSYKRMTDKMKQDEVSEAYWIAKSAADMKTYSANYAIKALKDGGRHKSEIEAYNEYKNLLKNNFNTEEISKKYMDYYIEKEKLVLRSHAKSYDVDKLKAFATVQSGKKVLREALGLEGRDVKPMQKYWKSVKSDGGGLKKSKDTAFKELTDGCCSIMSHTNKAEIENPSKGVKSVSAGIEAAHKRKIKERVYRAYGHNWNSAQSGAGLMMEYNEDGKYSVEKIQSLRKKTTDMKKAEVIEFINKLDCKNDDERACLYEVLYNQGQYKNPFKSQIDDHLKWGENRDDEWATDSSGGGGGWGRRGGRRGGRGGSKSSRTSAKSPETASGAFDGKVTNTFPPSNTSKKSNVDEAYRKKLRKLRDANRRVLS